MPESSHIDPHRMQCVEVWGGNRETDSSVVMVGLDAWVYSRPYEDDDEGGDIHYVSSCATGRITRLLLADVAGHGASAADLAGKLRSLMRRYVNFVDQRRFVSELNREFTEQSESGRFATAIVATYWAPKDELTLTNAGHPRPLWYRAGEGRWTVMGAESDTGEGTARIARSSDIPLGINESSYQVHKAQLREGDLILLYTDALVDAIDADDPTGKKRLGEGGLLELVQSIELTEPQQMIRALMDGLMKRSGRRPDDDVTLLLLKPNDVKPRGLIEVGAHMASKAAQKLFARSAPVA